MPDTALQQRDEAVMRARINGATLREIGDTFGLSPEGARQVSERAARRHILETMWHVWSAQREGRVLVLALPPTAEHEQQLVIRYLDWFLREVDRQVGETVRLKVHYRPAADGSLAFGLEDANFHPDTPSEEIA